MNIQGKVWGDTRLLFAKNNVEIHRISCPEEHAFCSVHCHEHKYNMFYIECGKMLIRAWKNDYDLVDDTIICAGQSCVIPPGEYHQFHNLCFGTVAYEIYWTELKADDIVRKSVGGSVPIR